MQIPKIDRLSVALRLMPQAILAMVLVGTPAKAGPVPPPDAVLYSGSLCAGFSGPCPAVLSTAGTVAIGNSYLTFGLTPSPSIEAFVTGGTMVGSGDPVPATGSFQTVHFNTPGYPARMQYYAQVIGPAGIPVPIDLAYTLTYSVNTSNPNLVGIAVVAVAGVLLNPSVYLNASAGQHPTFGVNADQIGTGISDANGPTPSTRSGTLTDTVLSNTEFDIGLFAYVFSDSRFPGSAFASVDPVLFIDPSFAALYPNYLTDFHIELSPGAGNAEVMPEPVTLTLFGGGLVGLVLMRCRKKKTV